MFSEDLDIFLADFGIDCSKGSYRFRAIRDMPDQVFALGPANAQSTMYEIKLKSSDASAMGLGDGDALTVDGVSYKAHVPRLIDDGAFTVVSLTKV